MTTPPPCPPRAPRAPCYFHDYLKYWFNAKKLLLDIISNPQKYDSPF